MSTSPIFERPRRVFQMLGKEFNFQFIPSIHFQEILRHTLELITTVEVGSAALHHSAQNITSNPEAKSQFNDPITTERMLRPLRRLLEEKVYDILHDVLLHQNGERVALDILKRQTAPLEIAGFVHLLLTDDEIIRALGLVADGLGKLMDRLLESQEVHQDTQ